MFLIPNIDDNGSATEEEVIKGNNYDAGYNCIIEIHLSK